MEQWQLVREDREAVIAALERAECDGIVPAIASFLDRFADFCIDISLLALLALLPDPRSRASIPQAFFGNVLLHKQLPRIGSFAEMGRVLFRSPTILNHLGFNWRQVNEGFYAGEGRRPFNEEALADFFALIDRDALWQFQLDLLPPLVEQCPELLGDGTLMMDCIDVTVPAGHRKRAGGKYKACVLVGYSQGCIYPLLCLFGDEHASDLVLGKEIMDALLKLLPGRTWTLLLDRGFIDGKWIGALKRKGVDVIIGIKRDMHLYDDALGLARLEGTGWTQVAAPNYNDGKSPKRYVTGWTGLETWQSCPVPLSAAVIEDRFDDRTKRYVIAGTDEVKATTLHGFFRKRWEIEEAFMELTRYWNIDKLGSCRHEVYLAQVYFALLAYALLRVFSDRHGDDPPDMALTPGRELAVYWRDCYAILLPSELFEIVFAHFDLWQANQQRLLEAMRYCEGRPRLSSTPVTTRTAPPNATTRDHEAKTDAPGLGPLRLEVSAGRRGTCDRHSPRV